MMGHPVKHPIDPDTGLCDICDGDAIREIRLGKRPAKRIIYVSEEERLTDPSIEEEEVIYVHDEPSSYVVQKEVAPKYVRKAVYQEPRVRSRRVVYEKPVEEPMVIRRAAVRHEHLPAQEVVVRRRTAQPQTLYYVDHGSKRVPRVTSPPVTTSRRVLVRRSPPPTLIKPAYTTRAVRVVHRRVVTPPPVIIKTVRAAPVRHIVSDTAVIGRRRRVRRAEVETIPSSPEIIHEDTATLSRSDPQFKETSQEIVERVPTPQAVPTVVKRSYTRLPPGVDVPPDGEYAMNDVDGGNKSLKDPSIYYIRSPSRAKLEGS